MLTFKTNGITSDGIQKAAWEVLGMKHKVRSKRGLRIWNEEIQDAITGKQEAYTRFLHIKSEEVWKQYKLKQNSAKQFVWRARQ